VHERRTSWWASTACILILAGALVVGRSLVPWSDSSHRVAPQTTSESATERQLGPPILRGRGAGDDALPELLSRALSGSRSAWHILHAQAADLSRAEQSHLRQRLSGELARAVHPTAIYRGGSDAPRLAARLADPELCENLLALLSNWSCVVTQLPLTDDRDDLRVLEAIREGVAAAGTRAQRARLSTLLRTFPSTDSVNLRAVDSAARTETRK
jgi:hypothetical protein